MRQLKACFLNRRDIIAIMPNAKIAKVPGSGTLATRTSGTPKAGAENPEALYNRSMETYDE